MASASSSSSEDPYPMDNDYEWLHGRVDAGIEDSINLVESVPVQMPAIEELQQRNLINVSREGTPLPSSPSCPLPGSVKPESNRPSYLLALPLELIDHILSFLSPLDVVATSATCRRLASSSKSDLVWQRHVQENVPGVKLTSPSPCSTFRELYMSHDPHWFLTKYKIWFSDYFLTGKIIITRFNPNGRSGNPDTRGCIEGYQLIAERDPPSFVPWEIDDEVLIHSFTPECRLHKDVPVLQLNARRPLPKTSENRFNRKIRMGLNEAPDISGVFSEFSLTSPVVPTSNMVLWPPSTIPARHRVRNANQESVAGVDSRPTTRSQVSNQAFRIRKWMEMGPRSRNPGMHIGEEVYTYATLDPKLYTPTEEKPFRGIWVGDYSGHGCEFLLMNQPDNETPFDESSVVRGEDETVEEWESRKREERIYRGSLEAIKLTGDPNVPRGEYTFIADDISKKGLVRKANDARFKGARIVQSRGHIAVRMFRNDKYIESQLIMISHDRLAQYWVGFGHISFYERVDLDKFIDPANDPLPTPKPVNK
ncbi:uncharacterized protein LY89DRAFT_503558 [Mollisia scopiformis]|uniref:F-box domain-containing protein n=1 Tax=Mollisia scopiformis TaxID=149040 RepID=A0A194XEY4_MOLSC|nr:uncharacterized protein LY89DRAFT_503558 [Mollisia scopiformis]KUJ18728.1 hypothetical protein LY89DRAFT_503558 [Mollisia scopiformis]